MINIVKGATNSFGLTLTEELDTNYPDFYYLFKFENKMTLETKYFVSEDTSTIPYRINIFSIVEASSDANLYGPIPTLSLQEGSWVYNAYQMDGAGLSPSSSNLDVNDSVKLLEYGKVWVIPNPCPVPGWGEVPVVPQYITDCPSSCPATLTLESVGVGISEGETVFSYTGVDLYGYIPSSEVERALLMIQISIDCDGVFTDLVGEYIGVQEEPFTGQTDASVYLSHPLDTGTCIRIVGRDCDGNLVYSNSVIVGESSIVISEPIVTCIDTLGWNIIIDITASSTSGSFGVQIQTNQPTWTTVDSFTGPSSGTGSWDVNVDNFGGTFPLEIPIRFIDDILLIYSNEEVITIESCTFLNFRTNSSIKCDLEDVFMQLQASAGNQSGNYEVQVFFNGNWESAGWTFSDTTNGLFSESINLSVSTLPGFNIEDFAGTSVDFRLIDTNILIPSTTLSLSVPTCEVSSLIFDSIDGPELISFSANNVYEVGNLWGAVPPDDILNLGLEISYDGGLTWNNGAVRQVLPSSPFTGTENSSYWQSVNFVDEFWYRLIGKDSLGNLIYSNEIVYITPSLVVIDNMSYIIGDPFSSVDVTYTNIYGRGGAGNNFVYLQESTDGITYYDFITIDITPGPRSATDNYSLPPLTNEYYYRMEGANFIGTPQYSNVWQYSFMRALYVNDFNTICGITASEDVLLGWAQSKNIDTLYLYDLNTVIATVPDYTVLNDFLTKALTYGIVDFYGFRASETSNIGAVVRSNASFNNAALGNLLNYSFENEFWNYDQGTGTPPGNDANSNSAWPEWLTQQQNIRTYAQSVGLSNDLYIGIIRDDVYSTPTATISTGLIDYTDRIHISCYIDSVTMDTLDGAFNDIESRLIDLGTAGTLAGKIVNVVVIFSAKLTDSYTYFQTHTFEEAYGKVVTSFNAASFTGKSNINLMGWNIYGYQQAQSL